MAGSLMAILLWHNPQKIHPKKNESKYFSIWMLPKSRATPKWMVKIMEHPMNNWMIWGYYNWNSSIGSSLAKTTLESSNKTGPQSCAHRKFHSNQTPQKEHGPPNATLLSTNIAMENSPFWWYLPGKMGIFMGYVGLPEGTPKYTNMVQGFLHKQVVFVVVLVCSFRGLLEF